MNLGTLEDILRLVTELADDQPEKVAITFDIPGYGEKEIIGVNLRFDGDVPVKVILKG